MSLTHNLITAFEEAIDAELSILEPSPTNSLDVIWALANLMAKHAAIHKGGKRSLNASYHMVLSEVVGAMHAHPELAVEFPLFVKVAGAKGEVIRD